MKQARQAMDAVLSYRYNGEITGEISIVDGEDIQKARIEGEWSSSGDSRIRISEAGTRDSTLEEFVTVGGQTLRRIADYADGAWVRLEDPLSAALSRNLVFPKLEDSEVVEGETIDGRSMYHVTGRYEPYFQRQSEHQVSHYGLFVDQETMRLRRLVIDYEYSTSVPADVAGGQVQTEIAQSGGHVVYDLFDYNEPLVIELPPLDPCNYSADAKERLSCDRFLQRIYWLGDRLQIAGPPDLELASTSFSSNVITEESRLTVAYEGLTTTGFTELIALHQWSRPEWKKYMAGFTGYDHKSVDVVKGGEKVCHCGGGIVYRRHDEKGLNWEPGGIRSGAGVRSSGVSQESTGSSDTWEAALCRLCLRR